MIPNAWKGFDFGLGDDADALRDTVARFSQERIGPRAEEIDRTNVFPRDLWPELGALGLHGRIAFRICYPEGEQFVLPAGRFMEDAP